MSNKENRRELSEKEKNMESGELDTLNSFIEEMSPYQLELLTTYAWKIVSGKPLKDK